MSESDEKGPRAVPASVIAPAARSCFRVVRTGRNPARKLINLCAVLAFAGAAGCNPPIKQYEIKNQPLRCDEANRFAHETLTGMGFAITAFDPAEPGRPGTLKGQREGGVTRAQTQSVVVRIDCAPAGASIDAAEEGKWLGQLDFKRAFYLSFVSVREAAARRAETEAKMAAHALPASVQRRDVRVLLAPVVGPTSKLDFGLDLTAGGVLPLRIQIDNLTERTYLLDPGEVRLTRADRRRVNPMSVEEAAARLAAARDAETGEPMTTLTQSQIAARLGDRLFTARRLPPGARAEGFLYFPAGEYKRGRMVLTEEESQETEGVMVEF